MTLSAGRARAVSRMTSRATVRRTTGRTVQDETTGREVTEWDVTHDRVPVRLRSRSTAGTRAVTSAGVDLQLAVMEAHFPARTADLDDGDLFEVVSGERAGSVWRIVEASAGDQQTARRVPVIEAPRPSEWEQP